MGESKHNGPWKTAGSDAVWGTTQIIERADGSGFTANCTADEARLIAATPELLEQARLFEKVIEYQIRVSEKKGDDEGARLQSFTLHQLREVLVKAGA